MFRVEVDQPSGVNYNLVESVRSLNDGVYHHVAIARQGATVLIYLDGMLDQSRPGAAAADLSNTANLMAGSLSETAAIAPATAPRTAVVTGLEDETEEPIEKKSEQ